MPHWKFRDKVELKVSDHRFICVTKLIMIYGFD